MEYKYVDEILGEDGLKHADLSVLKEGDELLRYAVIQPQGHVVGEDSGVRCLDTLEKLKRFVELAKAQSADVLMTPEYFCSWDIFVDINSGLFPAEKSLWVMCFQSITPNDLARITTECPNIKFIYDIPAESTGTFLNPLVYFFNAFDDHANVVWVALIQFKVKPMVDTDMQLEREKVILGDCLYIFRKEYSIHLMSIICSDALDFNPNEIAVRRAGDVGPWSNLPFLLLHPQLNMGPTHQIFREYRNQWIRKDVKKKQIICLNWASGTSLNGHTPQGKDFGKSAIYFKDDVVDNFDVHKSNHTKGLYYTYSNERNHGLYFNYQEHVFVFRLCKVGRALTNPASANHPLPTIENVYSWNGTTWSGILEADDGYLGKCPWRNQNPVYQVLATTPEPHQLEKEIIINRATGTSFSKADNFSRIESVFVTAHESIRRITFAHDVDAEAVSYRDEKIGIFEDLCQGVLPNLQALPDSLKHFVTPKVGKFKDGFNLSSTAGSYAAVAHLGYAQQKNAAKVFADLCKIVSNENSRKVCVWYRQGGQLNHFVNQNYSFTSGSDSIVDIAKEGQDDTRAN